MDDTIYKRQIEFDADAWTVVLKTKGEIELRTKRADVTLSEAVNEALMNRKT